MGKRTAKKTDEHDEANHGHHFGRLNWRPRPSVTDCVDTLQIRFWSRARPRLSALQRACAQKLLIELRGVGGDPIHRFISGGKAIDPALVALMIPDDHMPAGSRLVREGLHDR